VYGSVSVVVNAVSEEKKGSFELKCELLKVEITGRVNKTRVLRMGQGVTQSKDQLLHA